VFRRSRNLPLPLTTSVQSRPPHSVSLKSILILFYYIRLVFPSGPSASGFPTKTLYAFAFSRIFATGRIVRKKIKLLKSNSSSRLETLENSYAVTMRLIAERMLHGGQDGRNM